MKKAIRIFDIVLSVVLLPIIILIGIGNGFLPKDYVKYNDKNFVIQNVYSCDENAKYKNVDLQTANTVVQKNATVKLFNIFPIDDVNVKKENRKKVYVSGESFGVKLFTDGVIVVGTKSVDIDGKQYDPAGDCGIQTGDIIISINSKKVYTAADVELALNDNNGKEYKIKYKRDGQIYDTLLKPVYSNSQGCYKAGMWVRDSTAGIGTITFYNPENFKFASLGHPINDVDTNEIMPLLNGEAVEAYVNKVYKGTEDETGSLSCEFTNNIIGSLTKNTVCGVYGEYERTRQMNPDRLYEVASAQEVENGFAQILTTVEKGKPKLYSVEISKINYNNTKEQKSMVIKVTDDELIQKTGGIVQGMSGSPIIQNGRLVGAVTHVMVNNPKKGYGIFAQNMVEESEK